MLGVNKARVLVADPNVEMTFVKIFHNVITTFVICCFSRQFLG